MMIKNKKYNFLISNLSFSIEMGGLYCSIVYCLSNSNREFFSYVFSIQNEELYLFCSVCFLKCGKFKSFVRL